MAKLHRGFIVIALALVASACTSCGSSPAITKEEIPGDFLWSYEMNVTDEAASAEAAVPEEPADAPAGETEAPADAPAAEGEAPAPEDTGEVDRNADIEGLPATFIYIEVREPGHVKYEIQFGFLNPVKKEGSIELSESAFRNLYDLVIAADMFSLKRRYVGTEPTGKKETFVVKGNLRLMVIDVEGAKVPALQTMWEGIKAILLDKDQRIFDNPKEKADIFIIDRRSLEFHRGDCPRLNEVSDEFRIRRNTWQLCLDAGGWPCETCKPMEQR